MSKNILLIAQAVAAVIVIAAGYPVIKELGKLKVRQSVRDCGPQRHQSKSGTPTMGGVLTVGAVAASALAVLAIGAGEGAARCCSPSPSCWATAPSGSSTTT